MFCFVLFCCRIPRYLLLLKDLIANTDNVHADLPLLTKSLSALEATADKVNESVRVFANKQQVTFIHFPFCLCVMVCVCVCVCVMVCVWVCVCIE